MRRIIDGTAYDTETAELIKQIWYDEEQAETNILYRTRLGAFFYWQRYYTPGYILKEEITAITDDQAQKFLEQYGNELVEWYFGEMPEGGSAERRLTLRMPNNLANRLEEIAKVKATSLNRYINRCLERCAAEDGRPITVV